jgi:hypothetical protein
MELEASDINRFGAVTEDRRREQSVATYYGKQIYLGMFSCREQR